MVKSAVKNVDGGVSQVPALSPAQQELADERKHVQKYLQSCIETPQVQKFRRNRPKEAWLLILRAYAEGMTFVDITKMVKEKWDFDLYPKEVMNMVNVESAKLYIKDFHDQYMAKVLEVPIANKRIRIDDHQKNLDILNKRIAEINGQPPEERDDKNLVRMVALSTALKNSVREEMEKRPTVFNNVNVSMSGMSDEQLQRRKLELIRGIRGFEGRRASGTASDTEDIGAEAEGESS